MKKQYTAPEKEIIINKGKLNFFEAPRTFADMVDTFANSKLKIACIEKECKAMINARTTLIEEKENRVKSETYVDMTAHEEEIAKLNAEIEEIKAKKKSLIDGIKAKQFELTATDTNLWCAYREHKNGSLPEKDYVQAVAMWFKSFGVDAYADTIKSIIRDIGMKNATNGQMLKSEGKNFTAVMNEKPFLELFYRVVAQKCSDAGTIKPFDFKKNYYNA